MGVVERLIMRSKVMIVIRFRPFENVLINLWLLLIIYIGVEFIVELYFETMTTWKVSRFENYYLILFNLIYALIKFKYLR